MTGKTEECYWQAFNWLCSEVSECSPYCVGVDFERAFFKQVSIHFPNAKLIGCLFHFKQAAMKKMKEMAIEMDQISFAMKTGVYDLLTVIPVEDLQKGIAYVRTKIADHIMALDLDSSGQTESLAKWDKFFDDYFER